MILCVHRSLHTPSPSVQHFNHFNHFGPFQRSQMQPPKNSTALEAKLVSQQIWKRHFFAYVESKFTEFLCHTHTHSFFVLICRTSGSSLSAYGSSEHLCQIFFVCLSVFFLTLHCPKHEGNHIRQILGEREPKKMDRQID